jgi:hypothetical protein
VTKLPDLRRLITLPFDRHANVTGIYNVTYPAARIMFDDSGLWWAVPFARGESGSTYAFRLAPGVGHGAVLRCSNGHAVTIASSPDRAIAAALALECLLVGATFRARLQQASSHARDLLREAVSVTHGNPDTLERSLHMADLLPNWISPAPLEQEETRRETLWRITDEDMGLETTRAIWGRSLDSRLAPADADACARLLQGNHGLDGTHRSGGLMPRSEAARELLVACARRLTTPRPDPAWQSVIDALAHREQPAPADFISAIGPTPNGRAWDALAATSFWYMALTERVPSEHVDMAEDIAGESGAAHVIAARRVFS